MPAVWSKNKKSKQVKQESIYKVEEWCIRSHVFSYQITFLLLARLALPVSETRPWCLAHSRTLSRDSRHQHAPFPAPCDCEVPGGPHVLHGQPEPSACCGYTASSCRSRHGCGHCCGRCVRLCADTQSGDQCRGQGGRKVHASPALVALTQQHAPPTCLAH